jgi:hypothetical protein
MALIHFSLQHGTSLAEAREKLHQSVNELEQQLKALISRIEWSNDGACALVAGPGFEFKISVDEQAVIVEGDIPLIARLLANPAVAGVKRILEQTFQARLKE